MTRKLFYDDEDIIGYSDDIIADIEENIEGMDEDEREIFDELIEELKQYDWDLVKVSYHPMGAYVVRKLVEEWGTKE